MELIELCTLLGAADGSELNIVPNAGKVEGFGYYTFEDKFLMYRNSSIDMPLYLLLSYMEAESGVDRFMVDGAMYRDGDKIYCMQFASIDESPISPWIRVDFPSWRMPEKVVISWLNSQLALYYNILSSIFDESGLEEMPDCDEQWENSIENYNVKVASITGPAVVYLTLRYKGYKKPSLSKCFDTNIISLGLAPQLLHLCKAYPIMYEGAKVLYPDIVKEG